MRTVVPSPGRGLQLGPAAVGVDDRLHDRRARGRCRPGGGTGTDRRGRSARTPARRPRRPCPGPSSLHLEHGVGRRRGGPAPRPACPAACAPARCRRGWRRPGAAGRRRRATTTGAGGVGVDRPLGVHGARVGAPRRGRARARSTGPRSSGRPWSRRASSSRSSTRLPMRIASCSVRRIASASSSGSSRPPAR